MGMDGNRRRAGGAIGCQLAGGGRESRVTAPKMACSADCPGPKGIVQWLFSTDPAMTTGTRSPQWMPRCQNMVRAGRIGGATWKYRGSGLELDPENSIMTAKLPRVGCGIATPIDKRQVGGTLESGDGFFCTASSTTTTIHLTTITIAGSTSSRPGHPVRILATPPTGL